MSNKEISFLSVDANNLCQQQFETLKKHIIDTLNEVLKTVKEDDFEKAKQMTFNSPAGNDMGRTNNCIDFGFNGMKMDFLEVLYILNELKERSTG